MPNILNKLAFLVIFCPSTEFWEREGWEWMGLQKRGVHMKVEGVQYARVQYAFWCDVCVSSFHSTDVYYTHFRFNRSSIL